MEFPELVWFPLLIIISALAEGDTGKTVLASVIVEESQRLLQAHHISVAFFYCKHKDPRRNTFTAVSRGILVQLLHQNDSLLPYLYDKASSSGETILESRSLAKELLDTALKSLAKVYIIIDGLDECDRDERKTIISWFLSIIDTLSESNVDALRCIFISQDDTDIGRLLSNVPAIQITAENMSPDIQSYAAIWSKRIQEKFELSDEMRKSIIFTVTERAKGKTTTLV